MRDKMRRIVKQGYEQGDYSAAFRRYGPPSEMERLYLDRLLALTPPAPKILDLGCGTGLPVDKYLADRGADLTGIDISAKHVALAKGNLPSASYREGDILHAVLPEGSFDGIVSFYAIFHISPIPPKPASPSRSRYQGSRYAAAVADDLRSDLAQRGHCSRGH